MEVTYQYGQSYPLDYSRSVIGPRLDKPKWFALTVVRMKERAVSERLKQKGIHACYPEREKSWVIRGKRHVQKYPIISGIVYAKFRHQPQWDILRARQLITGVFAYNGRPIEIKGDLVRSLMGLPTVADKLEAAQRELLRVREGEKANINEGPFEGFLVDVTKVEKGKVWWELVTGGLSIKGESAQDIVSREIP